MTPRREPAESSTCRGWTHRNLFTPKRPLPRDWWDDWLNPELEGDQALVDAAVQAAVPVAESLEFYEVAPLRGDGPELIRPVRQLEGNEAWLTTEGRPE